MTDPTIKPQIPPGPNMGATKPVVVFAASFISLKYVMPWTHAHFPELAGQDFDAMVQSCVLGALVWATPHNIVLWLRSLYDTWKSPPPTAPGDHPPV